MQSTNALTGVLNAWQDGLPCLFISGNNKLNETTRFTNLNLRTYGQQEADIIPIVESITKHSVMIVDPQSVVYELEKAIYLANEGRKGPVWIDIPLDIQDMRINLDDLKGFDQVKTTNNYLLKDDLEYVQEKINRSQRPVILVGSGVASSGARNEFASLINNLKIPVVYTSSAPDIYGSSKELSIGSIGIMGCSRAGSFAVQNSDLLIVMGSRLSPMTTGSEYFKFARKALKIVIDIDEYEHSKNTIKIDKFIKSDIKLILKKLNKNNHIKKTNNDWINKCKHWKELFIKNEKSFISKKEVDLYELSDCLSELMPENANFVSDSGLIELIMPNNLKFKDNQRCIHPSSQGSMGFALPGIIGAYFACRKPIIAVIGDGSVMMNLQELESISYHKIPVKILIINNNAYAVIRKRQKELFRNRTIGTEPSDGVSVPDFQKSLILLKWTTVKYQIKII